MFSKNQKIKMIRIAATLEYMRNGFPADIDFNLDVNALTNDGQAIEHLNAKGVWNRYSKNNAR